MRPTDVLKPLGVFVLVIAVILAGTALVSTLSGSGSAASPDGEDIDGQSPGQFQPENVIATSAPEDGEITLEEADESKQILVDSGHGNQYSQSELAPLAEALSQAGHEVDFTPDTGDSGGFGQSSYNATLRQYDAVLIIQPTTGFTDAEIAGLRAYAEGGGRIAVLGEPPQLAVSGGLVASVSEVRFGAQDLTDAFGLRMSTQGLYNIEDSANDNNYESIVAGPAGDGALTEGVDNVTFDSAGYLVRTGDGPQISIRAVSGTETLERRQAGRYPVAARSGNMVMVADTSFLKSSELYDMDNERLVSNVLQFLVSGDKEEGVPEGDSGAGGGFGGDGGGGGGPTTPTARP
ncbi:MAG: DUF4350 domain-containing protein [Halosimplex sp.]